MRENRVFTIDPVGARDLDDALSVTKNEDGTYDVGVHIADVSHFVKVNTPIDRDSRKRATSVYLVQRSVPMLPPSLSEEICSLVAGQERLAMSVVFTMSEDARIIKKWFGRTVIKYVFAALHSWLYFLNYNARLQICSTTFVPTCSGCHRWQGSRKCSSW